MKRPRFLVAIAIALSVLVGCAEDSGSAIAEQSEDSTGKDSIAGDSTGEGSTEIAGNRELADRETIQTVFLQFTKAVEANDWKTATAALTPESQTKLARAYFTTV